MGNNLPISVEKLQTEMSQLLINLESLRGLILNPNTRPSIVECTLHYNLLCYPHFLLNGVQI